MRKVSFKEKPLTLVGRNFQNGQLAFDFRIVSEDLSEKNLASFGDKIKIFTTFLSLDTPVCDTQVKEFNRRASKVSPHVVIVAVSKDLPFAQKRFCDSFSIKNIHLFSDYKNSSFGINYGLLIKELNLLARAVLILDQNNVLRYTQIVKEVTRPPDYEEVLQKLEEVIKNPTVSAKSSFPTHCIPCEGKIKSLPKERVVKLLLTLDRWEYVEEKKIVKEYLFKDFVEAKYFLDLLSFIAEEQGHHPTFTLMYNKIKVTLTTHAANGLTENDFIMAAMIDQLQ